MIDSFFSAEIKTLGNPRAPPGAHCRGSDFLHGGFRGAADRCPARLGDLRARESLERLG